MPSSRVTPAPHDLDPNETARTADSATVVEAIPQAADADAVAGVDVDGCPDETAQDQAVADALADLADLQNAAAAQEEAEEARVKAAIAQGIPARVAEQMTPLQFEQLEQARGKVQAVVGWKWFGSARALICDTAFGPLAARRRHRRRRRPCAPQ